MRGIAWWLGLAVGLCVAGGLGCNDADDADDDAEDDDVADDDDTVGDDDDTVGDDDDTAGDDDDTAGDDDDSADDDDAIEVDTTRCQAAGAVFVDGAVGTDGGSCGSSASPCATIGYGVGQAVAGEAVCVRSGTYTEGWIQMADDVWVVSVDGPLQAVIYSGEYSAVRFEGVTGARIDGFEIYGDWAAGDPGDGLIRVLDASDITIRNTMVHDAPYDQDCIKVSGQVSGLLIENVIAYNPGPRTDGSNFQENIDIFGSGASSGDPPPVSDVTVRGCWLFHGDHGGDWLIYSKINVENILYENNVFGPSAGGGWGNAAVGIGTGEEGIPDPSAAVCTHAIVRNNVFVGCKGDAAFAVMNADDTWIYNNTFVANSGPDLRSVVMFRGNSHDLGPIDLTGNIFVDNDPQQSGATFWWVRDPLPVDWHHDHNLYLDNLATTDEPYTGEAHGLYGVDPLLSGPVVPDTSNPTLERIAEIVEGFTIGAGSPAIDAAPDQVAQPDHPAWHPGFTDQRWDIQGDARPPSDTWDIGADER